MWNFADNVPHNKSAMKEAVKRRVWPARRFRFLRRARSWLSPDGVSSLLRKNVELNLKCCRWCLFAVTCFKNWTSFTVPFSYWRLALLTGSLWSYRVVAVDSGSLTIGRNSNLGKPSLGSWFKFRDLPPPAPSIHLFGDKWFIERFFIKQTKTRRGVSILRRWRLNFNGRRKARLSSYHWTWGRNSDFVIALSFYP